MNYYKEDKQPYIYSYLNPVFQNKLDINFTTNLHFLN